MKKSKRIKWILLALAVIAALVAALFLWILPAIAYSNAQEDLKAGKIIEAYEAFAELSSYSDSKQQAEKIYPQYKHEKLKQAPEGSLVKFGTYDQDGKLGADEIEWMILDRDGTKVLLISRYGLSCKPYAPYFKETSWKESYVRYFLNSEFLETSFTKEEREMIVTVPIPGEIHPAALSGKPTPSTRDQVFLLSTQELETYFPHESSRICQSTPEARGERYGYENCYWWLRSPGIVTDCAMVVNPDGGYIENGVNVDHFEFCARPVIWVETAS